MRREPREAWHSIGDLAVSAVKTVGLPLVMGLLAWTLITLKDVSAELGKWPVEFKVLEVQLKDHSRRLDRLEAPIFNPPTR